MDSRRLIIIGSSGHAKSVIDVVEKIGTHRIVGLIDPVRLAGETVIGYPILGNEDRLPSLVAAESVTDCVVAIGDNFTRAAVADRVRALVPALRFALAVHPSAQVGRDVTLGEGCVVMAGVAINACSRIGRLCILNTASSVDHDCTLGDNASIAPGARLGGNVRLGAFAAIGIGAVVSHGVHVGEHSVIGAGAAVVEPVGAFQVAFRL